MWYPANAPRLCHQPFQNSPAASIVSDSSARVCCWGWVVGVVGVGSLGWVTVGWFMLTSVLAVPLLQPVKSNNPITAIEKVIIRFITPITPYRFLV